MRFTRLFLILLALTAAAILAIGVVDWILRIGAAGGFRIVPWGFLVALIGGALLSILAAGLGCAIAHDRGRHPRLTRLGMATSVIAATSIVVMSADSHSSYFVDDTAGLAWPMAITGFAAATGLLSLIHGRAEWWIRLRRGTLIAAAIAGSFWCLGLTLDPRNFSFEWSDGLIILGGWPVVTTFATMACAMAFARIPRRRIARVAMLLAYGLSVVLTAAALIATFGDWAPPPSWYTSSNQSYGWGIWYTSMHRDLVYIVGPIITVVPLAGIVLTVVSAFFQGEADRPPEPARPYSLQCPRCGLEHEARTGVHHCNRCGLRVEVRLA